MDAVEQKYKEAVGECLPDLLRVYLIKTEIDCLSRLYDVGGMKRRQFEDALEKIRLELERLSRA